MSFWEHFQRLEVLKKRISVYLSKAKKFLSTKDGKFIKENLMAIVLYGILVNLSLYLIFQYEISILNIIASGSAYYMFMEIVKVLSDNKFILFKGREK